MSSLLKDEKIFLNFKKKFSFIYKDKNLINTMKTHFDQNGAFIGYLLAFLSNRYQLPRISRTISLNKTPWLVLFDKIYKDQEILECYKKAALNPTIAFETLLNSFKCFDNIANEFVYLLNKEDIKLDLSDSTIKQFVIKGFSYILYNKVDCLVPYELSDIISDPKYETKVQIVIYNTRLFGDLKDLILANCSNKVNDFIVLILGMTKRLSVEK